MYFGLRSISSIYVIFYSNVILTNSTVKKSIKILRIQL